MNDVKGRWQVPRLWPGGRVFVICGGPSITEQKNQIANLPRPIIAVKHAGFLRPDADILYFSGRDSKRESLPLFVLFRDRLIVSRGAYKVEDAPDYVKVIGKSSVGDGGIMRLSKDPAVLAGYDSGSSAVNLAYLTGAAEICVLGMDFLGTHWMEGHPVPNAGEEKHGIHRRCMTQMAEDLAAEGVTVFNCSPISTLTCFPFRPLKDFL